MRWTSVCMHACIPLVTVVLAPSNRVLASDSFTLPSSATKFLRTHCLDCHGGELAEGNVRLDVFAKLSKDERLALLSKMQEQLHLNLMPPEEQPRPSDTKKKPFLDWIEMQLVESGKGLAFKQKMQNPHYGNYVDHDKLFSGEIKEDAYSPARLWRRNPNHFDVAKQTYFGVHNNPRATVGEVDKLKQPFNEGGNEGIGDYAALFYADSA